MSNTEESSLDSKKELDDYNMIEFSDCSLYYHQENTKLLVYDKFNLSINKGESVVLIGPSGCGKSTLLYLLAGLLKPSAGQVIVQGQKIDKPRQSTGFILQDYGLFPWLNVVDNIGLGLKIRGIHKKDRESVINKILEEMGLTSFARHYPGQLSGGQRQRVALARVLTLKPDLLLMDEPLSSLDALTRERLQNLLLEIQQREQLTTVLVTHDIEEAIFLGSRIIVLAGELPTRIIADLSNPMVGTENFRTTDNFFKLGVKVRGLLEGGRI